MNIETWNRARPHIEAALRYAGNTHDPDDIRELITQDRLQLWCGAESVIVTELTTYPQFMACRIFLAGGDLKELVEEMEPAVCDWAQRIGCKRMEIAGRSGWERVMKDYDRLAVCLVKELKS